MPHSDEQIDRLVGELAACKATILMLFTMVLDSEEKREIAQQLESEEGSLEEDFPKYFGAISIDDNRARDAYIGLRSWFGGALRRIADREDQPGE